MAPLFKSGRDLLDQGLDLSRRRDFARAREKFVDAAARLAKESGTVDVDLARAYADLMGCGSPNLDPVAERMLATFVRERLGGLELRPGLRPISGADLATQLELDARDRELTSLRDPTAADPVAYARALQELAGGYSRIADQVLFLPEMFHQRTIGAGGRVPVLMATSFEALGVAAQTTDPIGAAEQFQTAQQYWAQAGESARADAAGRLIEKLSLRAQCWFCGRSGAGHGVQFVSLPIDRDVSGLEGRTDSPLPSVDPAGRHLYVCKGCHAAIRLFAERIADQRTAALAEQLRAEMRALERRLRSGARP